MIKIIDKKNCCGCSACCCACPHSAITMQPDDEGFLYPTVNEELCTNCNICNSVCPVENPVDLPKETAATYVAQSTQETVLNESTSGGFIDALNSFVINELGGCAAGVEFDDGMMPCHSIADTCEKAKAFRGSKYAQSRLDFIFSDIKDLLKSGKTVVFTGTPCQTAGLVSFLKNDCDNLITVDIVCRSVPSPLLWQNYLEYQKKKFNSNIASINFRKKAYGYHSGALEIVFENGKKYLASNRTDPYMKAFHSDICSRPSCYSCAFKTKTRCSDFTVFDCWQPGEVAKETVTDNDRGYSNVVANTQRANQVISELKDIKIITADKSKIFDYCGNMEKNSVDYPETRNGFYDDLNKLGFEKAVNSRISISKADKLIEMAKPFAYGIKKKGLLKR